MPRGRARRRIQLIPRFQMEKHESNMRQHLDEPDEKTIAARASSPNRIELTSPEDPVQLRGGTQACFPSSHLPSFTSFRLRSTDHSSRIMGEPATTSNTYSRVWSIPHIRDAIIRSAPLDTCCALSLVNRDISDEARKQLSWLKARLARSRYIDLVSSSLDPDTAAIARKRSRW